VFSSTIINIDDEINTHLTGRLFINIGVWMDGWIDRQIIFTSSSGLC
jgi:hypothetical protein